MPFKIFRKQFCFQNCKVEGYRTNVCDMAHLVTMEEDRQVFLKCTGTNKIKLICNSGYYRKTNVNYISHSVLLVVRIVKCRSLGMWQG
jgi:hypothetical protein